MKQCRYEKQRNFPKYVCKARANGYRTPDGLYVAWGDGRYESRWHPHSVKYEDFQASRDADVWERRGESEWAVKNCKFCLFFCKFEIIRHFYANLKNLENSLFLMPKKQIRREMC